jgi:signal transduction histidine kinase
MLIELENFREDQYGRVGVLRQVELLDQSTRKALSELRRLLVDLRAQEFGEEDVVKLIKRALLERKGRSTTVAFGLEVTPEWPERIPAWAALEMFRLVTEAVDNAIRHSGARKIEVALDLTYRSAVVSITDDGRGMPGNDGYAHPAGLGMLGMSERATLLSGELEHERGRNGRGTCVRLTVPLVTLARSGV